MLMHKYIFIGENKRLTFKNQKDVRLKVCLSGIRLKREQKVAYFVCFVAH